MGMGDEIMATVQARMIHQMTGVKVGGRESPVWKNNPHFAEPGEPYIELPSRPGNRPYILGQTEDRFIWNPNHKAIPGDLFVPGNPVSRGTWVIEPNVKGTVTANNKAWPWERWQALVDRSDKDFIQMGKGPWLRGVKQVETASFMDAVSVLKLADGFIGTDGGLHHAAAALQVPAIVLWGGLVSPDILGYESHINIWSGVASCGSKRPCMHCVAAMESIAVEDVLEHV